MAEYDASRNIYQRIIAIMDDVNYLKKDDTVSTGSGKGYKAITEEKVTTIIHAEMVKHGVAIIPIEQVYDRTDSTLVDKNGYEKINRLATVATKYKVVNVDNPEDYFIAVSNGEGADTQDKGVGKAMTYAYKYLCLRLFAIPTGEDSDKISSESYTEKLEATEYRDGKISRQKAEILRQLIKQKGRDEDYICQYHNVGKLEDLTATKYAEVMKWIG